MARRRLPKYMLAQVVELAPVAGERTAVTLQVQSALPAIAARRVTVIKDGAPPKVIRPGQRFVVAPTGDVAPPPPGGGSTAMVSTALWYWVWVGTAHAPGLPGGPNDPEDPDEPTAPDDPEAPDAPDEPEEPEDPNGPEETPMPPRGSPEWDDLARDLCKGTSNPGDCIGLLLGEEEETGDTAPTGETGETGSEIPHTGDTGQFRW